MPTGNGLRLAGVGLLPGLLGACYTYHPALATPQPASHVSVVLSDKGSVAASPQIGPQALRVEGAVVATSDTGYLLAVSGVKSIAGAWVKWTGETVSLRRDDVSSVYVRRLSKGRSALFAAGVVAALTAAVVGFDIFGIGNDRIDTVACGTCDPGDQ